MELVRWLEGKRDAEGLNNRAFAEAIGMHESTWSRIRNGDRPIKVEDLGAIQLRYTSECQTVLDLFRQDQERAA